jgi:hypothetical protein
MKSTPPVIVVGLPRSGSSYLAHVLSGMESWFVFDDLYPYQKAAALGINRHTNLAKNNALLKSYINALAWQLRAKIKYEKNFIIPNLNWEDTFEMEAAILKALECRASLYWHQVTEEFVMRIALTLGKQRWGYKTPQDFFHMDELADIFPEVRFIYILRSPTKVLKSFKNLPKIKTDGTQDGVSRQYHPIIYSLYWKKAYQKVQAFKEGKKAPIEIVKFEELIQNPTLVGKQLSCFLEDNIMKDVFRQEGNSSFQKKSVISLTQTEIWLCQLIVGKSLKEAGYEKQKPNPSFADLIDLISTTTTFTGYQLERFFTNKRARNSILSFIK